MALDATTRTGAVSRRPHFPDAMVASAVTSVTDAGPSRPMLALYAVTGAALGDPRSDRHDRHAACIQARGWDRGGSRVLRWIRVGDVGRSGSDVTRQSAPHDQLDQHVDAVSRRLGPRRHQPLSQWATRPADHDHQYQRRDDDVDYDLDEYHHNERAGNDNHHADVSSRLGLRRYKSLSQRSARTHALTPRRTEEIIAT